MGIITTVSTWIIPCVILLVLVVATLKRIPTYELFVEGGKEGVKMAFSLLPFLVGMIVAIAILRSSGALEAFIDLISPEIGRASCRERVRALACSQGADTHGIC